MISKNYGAAASELDDLLESVRPEWAATVHILSASESEALEAGTLDRIPMTSWGAIDVSRCQVVEEISIASESGMAEALGRLISEHASAVDRVYIVWGNALIPTLALGARAAIEHSDGIVAASHDLWVVTPDGHVIEKYHEGRMVLVAVG